METFEGLTLDEYGCFADWPQAIATWSGDRMAPTNPTPDDIRTEDIARGLANECRWSGQCRFYSVAEHSVLVSFMVPTLEALMHDAAEAYLGDMARPTKTHSDLGRAYSLLERPLELAIVEKFGLIYPWSAEVKDADYAMGFAEAKELVPHLGALMESSSIDTPPLEMWTPDQAYAAFLARFYILGGTA